MPSSIHDLSPTTLLNIAQALANQRLSLDSSHHLIKQYANAEESRLISIEFQKFRAVNMTGEAAVYTLQLIAEEKQKFQNYQNNIEVVWTVPDVNGIHSRDTALVVQELFQEAQEHILISTYVLDRAEKANTIFASLAQRMAENQDLQVQIILNVERPYKSDTASSILLREFADNFRQKVWISSRLPDVFYDSRSLSETENYTRSCLHAKFVVADHANVFLTSANFTEAAHQRNIEAGVLLEDAILAQTIERQVDLLIKNKVLLKVPVL